MQLTVPDEKMFHRALSSSLQEPMRGGLGLQDWFRGSGALLSVSFRTLVSDGLGSHQLPRFFRPGSLGGRLRSQIHFKASGAGAAV